jgi:protein-tyrosine phosphatase
MQINLLSFIGFYGAASAKLANDMTKEKVASFLGTDVHKLQQVAPLDKMSKNISVIKNLSKHKWENKNLLL